MVRTEVDGGVSDSLADLVDDTLGSNGVDGTSLDEGESTVGIAEEGGVRKRWEAGVLGTYFS